MVHIVYNRIRVMQNMARPFATASQRINYILFLSACWHRKDTSSRSEVQRYLFETLMQIEGNRGVIGNHTKNILPRRRYILWHLYMISRNELGDYSPYTA